MKKYLFKFDYLDIEELDSFIDRFINNIISPLGPTQEIYVSLVIIHEGDIFLSRLMKVKNNIQSLDLLKRSLLNGPVGSYLRIHETMDLTKCYINYNIQ